MGNNDDMLLEKIPSLYKFKKTSKFKIRHLWMADHKVIASLSQTCYLYKVHNKVIVVAHVGL